MDPVSEVKRTLDAISTTGVSFRQLSTTLTRTNPTDFLANTTVALTRVEKSQFLAKDLIAILSPKGKTSPSNMLIEVIAAKDLLDRHQPTKEVLLLAMSIIAQELSNNTVNIPSNLINKEYKASGLNSFTDKTSKDANPISISIHNLGSSSMELAFTVRAASKIVNRLDSCGLPNTHGEFANDNAFTGLYGLLRTVGLPRIEEFNNFFIAEQGLGHTNDSVLSPVIQKAISDFIKSGCRYSVSINDAKPTFREKIAAFINPENKPIFKRIIISPIIDNVDSTTARKNAFAINAISWLLQQHHDK